MGHQLQKLSATEVKKKKKPGMYGDGGGLWLQVSALGAKSLLGCASAGSKFSIGQANLITNGMSREDVIRVMGSKPLAISNQGKTFHLVLRRRQLAYWIHDHLPYSEAEFFHGEGMCCFGLSWHEKPKKTVTSWMKPRVLLKNAHDQRGFAKWYEGFPKYQGGS